MGAQKNRLIETVLLSTHNICFTSEIRKLGFNLALLSGGGKGISKFYYIALYYCRKVCQCIQKG